MNDVMHLIETAQYAALEAGRAIMEVYQSGEFSISLKKDESPLTRADKIAHRIITEYLGKTGLPVLSEEGINIDFRERKSWEYFWLIDPLDGTKEFINKTAEFTVNIALIRQNIAIGGVIYLPCPDILYYGSIETGVNKKEKEKRFQFSPLPERRKLDDLLQKTNLAVVASRSHLTTETKDFIAQFKNPTIITSGSSLKFMLLLENRADIYPRLGKTMEWDTAAAQAILNALNRGVYCTDLKSELLYNKPDLANPFFIAF